MALRFITAHKKQNTNVSVASVPQERVKNVLGTALTRYILTGTDVRAYLEERFGKEYQFDLSSKCERWYFWAPRTVTKEEWLDYIDELEKKAPRRASTC